jgi:hypothetical protein
MSPLRLLSSELINHGFVYFAPLPFSKLTICRGRTDKLRSVSLALSVYAQLPLVHFNLMLHVDEAVQL